MTVERLHGLSCIYTNTDVLTNKMTELEAMIEKNKIDIIALTETLPKSYSNYTQPEDFTFVLDGYNSIQCFKGRGLCLFIKDTIKIDRISPYEDIFQTSLFVKIKTAEDTLTLGLIYRSPTSDEEDNKKTTCTDWPCCT